MSKLRLKDPVAPQQLIGDIECPEAPEPDYHRECSCTCDVPMGCHGIQGESYFWSLPSLHKILGEPGQDGATGPDGCIGDLGKEGQPGQPGDDGPMGDRGMFKYRLMIGAANFSLI